MLCCHSEESQQVGDLFREEPSEIHQRQEQVLYLGRKSHMQQYRLTCSEAALEEWVMVCNKLSIIQQCALMAESH